MRLGCLSFSQFLEGLRAIEGADYGVAPIYGLCSMAHRSNLQLPAGRWCMREELMTSSLEQHPLIMQSITRHRCIFLNNYGRFTEYEK
jgi:hypothetical protein